MAVDKIAQWLLEGPPWVRYRTRLDLLGQSHDDPQVIADRHALISHPQVKEIVAELADWPGRMLTNHKDAAHPLHKLTFLADLGLKVGDPGIDKIIKRIMNRVSPEGPFQINIRPRDKGDGQLAWMLCDAPLVVYALIKFGLSDDPKVQAALDYLTSLVRDNGWPCVVLPEFGKWRGPGRKDDPCPYANLVMLKALSQLEETRQGEAAAGGVKTLLDLWSQSRERHPYIFYMGTDFRKLKGPFIWYDILHVADVLSHFESAGRDPRFVEMVEIIKNKADADGRFTPQAIYKAWAGWDFGQKKAPSAWLTLLARRLTSISGDAQTPAP